MKCEKYKWGGGYLEGEEGGSFLRARERGKKKRSGVFDEVNRGAKGGLTVG